MIEDKVTGPEVADALIDAICEFKEESGKDPKSMEMCESFYDKLCSFMEGHTCVETPKKDSEFTGEFWGVPFNVFPDE